MKNQENGILNANKPMRFWLWITILSILIVVAIGTYYMQSDDPIADKDIFRSYYQPFPNQIDPINTVGSNQNLSAFQYYESGDYNEAISLFIPKLSDKHARWYYAQTMLAIGDLPVARDILEQFTRTKDETYGIDARWYLALLYIKAEELSQAKKQLQLLLTAGNTEYRKRSIELLAQISN